jgi:hypothetical protein
MVVTATILCLGGTRAIGEEMTSSPLDGTRDTKVAANAFWLPPQVWAVGLLVWALTWTGWAIWRLALAP